MAAWLSLSTGSLRTQTGRYLPSSEPREECDVVRCLHDRARGIISMQDNFQKKVDHLARVLEQNGYPANLTAMPLPHPHRKQQTQAAKTRDRKRRDHWW